MASAKGQVLPAERARQTEDILAGDHRDFFSRVCFRSNELHYADDRSTWWFRAWHEAGPILVWITVALTVYSGLGYAWRHRELIAPINRTGRRELLTANAAAAESVEEALRNLDSIAGLKFDVLRRIFPKLPHVVNCHFACHAKAGHASDRQNR